MRRLALLAAALAAAGCGGSQEQPRGGAAYPAWLGGEFSDGTLAFRYPSSWTRGSSDRFGTTLSDNRSRNPAFVGVRYLDDVSSSREQLAAFAGRTLRPPDGRGLTLLYTQTVLLGGRPGVEATFMWATRATTPIGPTMRTFAVDLRGGRTAFIVLAAERRRLHGAHFGWVRKTLHWTDAPRRNRPPGGRHINEP